MAFWKGLGRHQAKMLFGPKLTRCNSGSWANLVALGHLTLSCCRQVLRKGTLFLHNEQKPYECLHPSTSQCQSCISATDRKPSAGCWLRWGWFLPCCSSAAPDFSRARGGTALTTIRLFLIFYTENMLLWRARGRNVQPLQRILAEAAHSFCWYLQALCCHPHQGWK